MEQTAMVSGGSVGDYWGVGDGAIEGRDLTDCEKGIAGGAIAGVAGGIKGFLAGAIGGAVAGGCGD